MPVKIIGLRNSIASGSKLQASGLTSVACSLWRVACSCFIFLFAFFILRYPCYAAPCYGTKMPLKKGLFAGLQTHAIFKRYLENEFGKVRSLQHFFLLSYGVYDWLAIDLKAGAGYIKQRPVTSSEIDYSTNFAGGYGFRLKLYDKKDTRMVFGFQHISVHPKSVHLGTVKNKAILDDWQFSFLVSRDIFKVTPYLGTCWSRIDYIHWTGSDRKRIMSDLTKSTGLIFGLDIPVSKKVWVNLEGQFLDSEDCSFSLNYNF
jgi:hypothetical protein